MKYSIRLLFSIILTVWLLGAPVTVLAQDETESTLTGFSNVSLDVRAEYDDLADLGGKLLLVILEGQIVANEPPDEMSVEVSFMVPSGVEMYSAGYKDAFGGYHRGYDYAGPPEREISGIPGWEIITITMQSDMFVIEYYDPNIIIGEGDRSISYQFRWLYPIINLTVLVQAPLGAKDFEVTPEGQQGDYLGYEYYFYQFENIPFNGLDEQHPIEFEIRYLVGGGANTLLIISIIIGFFAIFAVFYFWSKKPGDFARAERRRKLKSQQTNQAPGQVKSGTPANFCRHCGQKLEKPSKFCPYCGGGI